MLKNTICLHFSLNFLYFMRQTKGFNPLERPFAFQTGFTLIELLVVIAIIGTLSTMAAVSMADAKAKARDVKRVADLSQLQRAIELAFIDDRNYVTVLGPGCDAVGEKIALCDGTVRNFMTGIDRFHDPNGTAACLTPAPGCDFGIHDNPPTATTFQIGFWLERGVGDLGSGAHYLTQRGLQ
jgi:general secretion pathway protein G